MKAKLSSKTIQALNSQDKPYEVTDTDLKGFLLRVQPSGIMSYYFAYRNAEGKKNRYKIGKHGAVTPAQARDIALQLSAKVIGGEDIQERKKQNRHAAEKAKAKTLVGFLNIRYSEWVTIERKTGKETIERIKHNFAEFLNRPLHEINTWVIEKWRAQQLKEGKQPTTVNRDITALKALLAKAVEWNVLENHPLHKLKPIKTERDVSVRYLTQDEEKQLRHALITRGNNAKRERSNANQWRQERNYELMPTLDEMKYADYLEPMVLLAINTGMRRGELFNLTWQDVNFGLKNLTVRGVVAKSGRTRHIPLNHEALTTLQQWHKQSSKSVLIFPGKDGQRFGSIKKSWNKLLADANIQKFRFHDLRHHFASKLVMAGVDLNTVRELLGHADIAMTLRYAHLAPEHKARAVEKLLAV